MGSGLSKKDPNCPELKYCTLTGLYPDCSWDLKLVKKLILEKKLAPIYPGSENASDQIEALEKMLEECPICFLHYPSLNRSSCCRQGICTECFLQIKPNISSPINCPFCNRAKYGVFYSGPLTKEEKVKELEEQQKVTELQIKLQIEQERERAYSLPTHFDRAKELQQEEIRNRRESLNRSSARSSTTTTTTPSFDQYSSSAPSLANNINFGRSPRSSSRSSSSVAEEGAPFFDDWAALAEEAEIEEILLREAIQLSLQGRPASQNSGRVEVPQSPPSRSPGPGTSGAGGGAGSSANMVSNNSRIGGAAS